MTEKKYTVEYCKSNEVAIKVNSKEEGNQVIKYFKPDAIEHPFTSERTLPYYLYYDSNNATYQINWVSTDEDENYKPYISDKEIITFEQFIQDNMKKLPKKWFVHSKTKEEDKIIVDWFNEKFSKNVNYDFHIGGFCCTSDGQYSYCKSYKIEEEYTEITFDEFKENFVKEQKKIIGYKLIKREYEKAVELIANNYIVHNNLTLLEYLKVGGYSNVCVKSLEESGVLDLWFEPVYEPEKKKLETIEMGDFTLSITKDGIFHKEENITDFVKQMMDFRENKFSKWKYSIKQIEFYSTGCEKSRTWLHEWELVWEKYKEFNK